MPYCPDCGVEIGQAPACPLCGATNPRTRAEEKAANFTDDPLSRPFTPQESRKIAWEVLSVAFAIAVIALLSINLIVSGRISWSLYPISTFAFIWVVATSFLVVRKAPRLRIALAALDLPLYLLALGAFVGDSSWAWKLAVPIALFAELVALCVGLIVRASRRKGLNVLSYCLVGAALVCLGVEILVDLYMGGGIRLAWSAITALALVPIASFLLYLHYRVATSTNLRRLFKL
ncbi:MAG TPA: DUF6320 domain-containing protein [Rectinemataceae bacterium]